MTEYLASILWRVKNHSRFCSADDVIEDIRANVESILNTRLMIPDEYVLRPTNKESLKRLNDSLVNYGVVDFQSMNMGDSTMEKRFCESIRIAIERFEPRLSRAKVEMAASARNRLINVQVKAQLMVQPFEDVRFESGLDTDSQKFVVS